MSLLCFHFHSEQSKLIFDVHDRLQVWGCWRHVGRVRGAGGSVRQVQVTAFDREARNFAEDHHSTIQCSSEKVYLL